MPDLAVHFYFGRSVLSSLPPDCNIEHGEFDFALSGPDDWFYCFTDRKLCLRRMSVAVEAALPALADAVLEEIKGEYYA